MHQNLSWRETSMALYFVALVLMSLGIGMTKNVGTTKPAWGLSDEATDTPEWQYQLACLRWLSRGNAATLQPIILCIGTGKTEGLQLQLLGAESTVEKMQWRSQIGTRGERLKLNSLCPLQCQELVRMNQCLLNCLGVGHTSLDQVAALAASQGFSAKLTGAGGGGCALLVYHVGTLPGPHKPRR